MKIKGESLWKSDPPSGLLLRSIKLLGWWRSRLRLLSRRRWWRHFFFFLRCVWLRVWVAMVTAETTYRWNGMLVVLFIMEELFVNACCHLHHFAGSTFF